MDSFYAQKRPRIEPPAAVKIGAGNRLVIELYEGGIFNATGDTSACKEMLLKPFGWKWVVALKMWRHEAGDQRLLSQMRTIADRDGVQLDVLDRGNQPRATISVQQLLAQEEARHTGAGQASQGSWSEGESQCSQGSVAPGCTPATSTWQPTVSTPYTGSAPRAAPSAVPTHPPSARRDLTAALDEEAALDAALASVDVEALVGAQGGSSAAATSTAAAWERQGSQSSLSPGGISGTQPPAATPESQGGSPVPGLTAEQLERIEANKRKALALRAQKGQP